MENVDTKLNRIEELMSCEITSEKMLEIMEEIGLSGYKKEDVESFRLWND